MSVERILQICVAVMAVLATTLLGIGQQNVYLPLVALFAASASLIFTDALAWFRLNRGVANVFALIAAGYSLSSFFRFDKEQQLLSIANLLVYLQFILFFQQKSPRVYWQLMILGLLQVVVAVALSLELIAAMIIVAYMLVGVTALTFCFLHRESLRVTGQLPEPQVTFPRRKARSRVFTASADPPTKPTALFQANPRELSWELIGSRLLRQIAAMGLLSMLFATVLFYIVPRRGDSIWQGPGGSRSETGFSELQNIRFDEEGLIAQSDDPVMRVAFRQPDTGGNYPIMGRAYFRGIVMMHYSLSKRQWTQRIDRRGNGPPASLLDPPASPHLVRQEVALEPSNGQLIFSVYPWWEDESHPNCVALDNVNARLFLPRHRREYDQGPSRYSILTDAFRSGWQIRATSFRHDPYRRYDLSMSRRLRDFMTDVNADTPPGTYPDLFDLNAFAGLAEKAGQVIQSSIHVDPTNHLQVAKALEEHFRTSADYRYSLDFRQIQRDDRLDPLEDFVVHHRTGHCEYFAGALALMLRSRRIPARVVVGYVGGELNPMGGFYQIRKKDAHAWVEAYIAPRHFDEEMLLPLDAERTGIWYRLDPTPASGEAGTSTTASSQLMFQVDQFLDYFRFVWSDYIVGLDEERQRSVYTRISERPPDAMGGSRVRMWLDQAAQKLGLANRDEEGGLRPNWPLAWCLIAVGVIGCMIARRVVRRRNNGKTKGVVSRLVSRIVGVILPGLASRGQKLSARRPHKSVHVEFYARLVRLVLPLGLIRPAGQTPQELAELIRGRLLQLHQNESIASLPLRIVQAFYRVRFGGAALDTVERESIEQALSKLERALTPPPD